jgi:lysophospholipase L1-like esterase
MKVGRRVALLISSLILSFAAWAQSGEHWVSTWAASPQQRVAFPQPPRPAQAPATAAPTQTTAAAPANAPAPGSNFNNQTVRMVVHTSIGGRRARVQLSNAYGAAALVVRSAHIALRDKDSAIVPDTDKALSFNGKPSVVIPPGAQMVSDAIDFNVPKLADVMVSIYLPSETGSPTTHATGLHTTYISQEGDFTAQPVISDAATTQSWYFLASLDVLAPPDSAALVTFGDSITDGARSTPNTDSSWPSVLARRLAANPATLNVAVLNQGISGNRVLRENAGTNALARLDRDALAQSGVKWMIFMEGINDIGQGLRANAPGDQMVTADDLIGGLKQVIERAHSHGIKAIGATLTPFSGAAYYSDAGETVRQAVNQFIRSGAFDAVVDFDAVTRDSENPKVFKAEYDSGDHLHPGDAGYKAMAESIDLSLFAQPKH